MSELTGNVGDMIAKAKESVDDIASSAAQNANAARNAIKEPYEAAKDLAGKGTEVVNSAKGYVEAHPWPAVMGGIALGILIGAMARRR